MSSIIRSTLHALEPVAAFIKPAASQLSQFATRAFATGQMAAAPLIGRLAPLKEPIKAALGSKITIASLALGTAVFVVYLIAKRPATPAIPDAPAIPAKPAAPATLAKDPRRAQPADDTVTDKGNGRPSKAQMRREMLRAMIRDCDATTAS